MVLGERTSEPVAGMLFWCKGENGGKFMSSVQLLDKTRKIGKLLHNNNSSKVVFNDICHVLCEILSSNVLVISKKGKILGVGAASGGESMNGLIAGKDCGVRYGGRDFL